MSDMLCFSSQARSFSVSRSMLVIKTSYVPKSVLTTPNMLCQSCTKIGTPSSKSDHQMPRTIHGMTGTPTHACWSGMRRRCLNPNNASYPIYGGRGIRICKRWDDFRLFLEDMGEKPEGRSIDRINNDGDYEPGNCRWATQSEQQRNKSNKRLLTLNNVTLHVVEWCEMLGLQRNVVQVRLYHGWSTERALLQPVRQRRQGIRA